VVEVAERQGVEANLASLPGGNLKRFPQRFRRRQADEDRALTWIRISGEMKPHIRGPPE